MLNFKDKLVRDKIVDRIQSENPTILRFHKLDDAYDINKALICKIIEEANELNLASGHYEKAEELGDLLAVIDEYVKRNKEIYKSSLIIRQDKKERLGEFEDMCYIHEYQK